MKTAKELKDSRGEKLETAQGIINAAKGEKRELKPEEVTQFDSLHNEITALDAQIAQAEKMEGIAARTATPVQGYHTGAAGNKNTSDAEQRDLNKFSLAKAIRQRQDGEPLDGIEKEVIAEGIKEAQSRGYTPQGNIIIPYELFSINKEGRDVVRENVEARRERRDMTATGTTSVTGDQGGMTIETTIGRLYEALFNRLVLNSLGATFMPNMVGNMDLPRLVKGTSPTFKTENAAATEVSPTITKTSLTPHRLPAYIEVSNQLLRQSNANIDQVLRRYLTDELSSLFDKMGISGSGSSQEPTGILATSGIGLVYAGGAASNSTNTAGAAPVWADFPNLYKEVAIDNADMGSLAYLTNPNLVAKLQNTEKSENTAAFIMGEGTPARINGFNTGITNNVPSNIEKGASGTTLSACIFGNFRDLWMAMWGGIELMVNPYSLDTTGMTRINAALYGDVAVARPESFAACKDFITT